MKTFTKSIALVITALLLSLNTFATGFEFEDESYIDDIPFDTNEVSAEINYQIALAVDFNLDEEEYINDIPSDIIPNNSASCNSATQEFFLDEEEYIDDIPSVILNKIASTHYASTK